MGDRSQSIIAAEEIFKKLFGVIDSVDFSLNYLCPSHLAPNPTPLFMIRVGLDQLQQCQC